MKLLTFRTQRKWSQEYVARQMEVSRATIVNWERGYTEPNASEAIKLANLFNTTVEKLMEDKNGKGKVN